MANSIVALTDTASQVAELQRRQKLAEALSAQGAAPIEVQSYKGIQAPISPFSALAKVLQTYMGAKQAADAIKGEKEARKTARDEAVNYFKDLGKTVTPVLVAPTGAPEIINTGVPTADFTSASGSLKDMRKQLGTKPDEIAAAKNFVPPTQPVQVAQPPIMQAPGIDGSMAGAPMVRAVPGPVDNGPARMPMANAPSIQAPQLYGNEQAPVAAYTPQQKMAMLLEGSMSGNPYVEKMAPSMYDALQAKITSNEDLASKMRGVARLNLPDEQKQALGAAADLGGIKGFEAAATEIIKNQVGEHFVPATSEQLSGYPKGTTGQVSTITGKLFNVYNPSGDLNAAAQLQLEYANLGLRREQMNRSRLAPPTTIEHIVNGEPVQLTAMFDNKNGRYVDMTGNVVDPTGLRVLPNGGTRATLGLLRVSTAAADAATGIENLSKLPANSRLGWFSQAKNTPLGALSRTLSPQEAQDMRATASGLARAMGGLATGGLAVDTATQASYEALIPQAGQSRLTALRQMGELRQQAENGIDSALANPYISPDQKKFLVAAKTKIANAVPWTPSDVSALETSGKSNATMRSMGTGVPLANNGAPATPTAADSKSTSSIPKPAGISQAAWNVMPPERKALFAPKDKR